MKDRNGNETLCGGGCPMARERGCLYAECGLYGLAEPYGSREKYEQNLREKKLREKKSMSNIQIG